MKNALEKIVYHSTSINTGLNKIMREKILPFFLEKEIKRVLDYGCGRYFKDALFLTANGLVVDAVDLEEQVKEVDPERAKLINNLTTEIISSDYDAALLNFVLNVIPSQEQRQEVLEKAYDATKKEGYLILSLRSIKDVERNVQPKGILFEDGFLMKRGNTFTFQKGYKREEVEGLLYSCGLNILKIYNAGNAYIALSQK